MLKCTLCSGPQSMYFQEPQGVDVTPIALSSHTVVQNIDPKEKPLDEIVQEVAIVVQNKTLF